MEEEKKFTFEEVFKQNELRIYYHIQRLGIIDLHREFYTEGLYAMWMAYKRYDPSKGPMGTYFNLYIRNRLIDMIRKKASEEKKDEQIVHAISVDVDEGNINKNNQMPVPVMPSTEIPIEDDQFWEQLRSKLTENQWKYVYYHIIHNYTFTEIAELEGVSREAVKSWAKGTRKKLRQMLHGDGSLVASKRRRGREQT